jgi:hypothetical protein
MLTTKPATRAEGVSHFCLRILVFRKALPPLWQFRVVVLSPRGAHYPDATRLPFLHSQENSAATLPACALISPLPMFQTNLFLPDHHHYFNACRWFLSRAEAAKAEADAG